MKVFGPKQNIYSSLAEIAQAVGHPHRLELLEYLAQGQRTVEDLTALSKLTFANTSRHLQILRRARLVETERQSKYILYSLVCEENLVKFLRALGAVGEHNRAEVRQIMSDYFSARDALAPVSREELVSRLRDGTVTLIDVRPEDEFRLGHLRGAINMPLEKLNKRLSCMPKTHEIVAYCRGPYCVLSFEAVALLRAKGYRARRLVDGFPEWKAAGFEVEAPV